jgi:alpha-beta hydrolase superfamily lysophospholipase
VTGVQTCALPISIKLFSDLWKNGETLLRNRQQINIPFLLMHGTDDPLCSFQAGKSFAQNAGEYAAFKAWEGKRHDLLNDADSEHVFQYVMKWLSNKVIENGTV